MSLVLKKNSKKSQGLHSPAWHPNFRNYALLPDTKVVRTTFFINGLCALLVMIVALYIGYREYKIADLRAELQKMDNGIAAEKPNSDQVIALYNRFKDLDGRIQMVDGFLKGQRIKLPDLIIRIGQTLPKKIGIVAVECRDSVTVIKGYVQGASEMASGVASAYEKQLRENADIGREFDNISLTNLVRDMQKGRLTFEMVLHYKAAKDSKKK